MLTLLNAAFAAERRCIFSYSFTVNNIPKDTKKVRIWVPYPAQNSCQKVKDLSANLPYAPRLTRDNKYSNQMLYYEIKDPGPSIAINRTYAITRNEFQNRPLSKSQKKPPYRIGRSADLAKYQAEDGFVTVTEYVERLAEELTEDKKTETQKSKAIYDYLFQNMSYDKTEPGWGKGDIERVCRLWKGNCTDFHSLFIALCRSCGIPAKFLMGVPLSEAKETSPGGYHCWAEFYSPTYGWVPVDISEAWKNKSRYEYFFGAVDENRVEFSQGRGIRLSPSQTGAPLNYFIYPYVEIDGKTFDEVATKFQYEDLT